MQIERLTPLAKQLLAVAIDDNTQDLWLWEHAERVMRLTQMVIGLPELRGQDIDINAVGAAALFHDAGWIVEHQQGRHQRWQLLSRPTNDIQRHLGAAMLQEHAGHLLAGATLRLAGEAIRQCNDRHTSLLEAQVLAEAEALDEFGSLYLLRQFRVYQAEGRPLVQLVNSWQRQKEYRYWDLRLADGFRFETTRELARQRLAAVDAFIVALHRDLHGEDLRRAVAAPGPTAAAGP